MSEIEKIIDEFKIKLEKLNSDFSYVENKTNPSYLDIFDCYSLEEPFYLLFTIWIYHEYNDDTSSIKYTLTCHLCLEKELVCPYISHEYDGYLTTGKNKINNDGIQEVFDLMNQFLLVYKKYKNQSIVYNTLTKKI